MKTLYERLKPEHKAKLADEATRWPAIIKSVIDELEANYILLNISYGCVCCLANSLNLPDSNITTIVDLFEANELLNVNSK